jgi:hypothetical protein
VHLHLCMPLHCKQDRSRVVVACMPPLLSILPSVSSSCMHSWPALLWCLTSCCTAAVRAHPCRSAPSLKHESYLDRTSCVACNLHQGMMLEQASCPAMAQAMLPSPEGLYFMCTAAADPSATHRHTSPSTHQALPPAPLHPCHHTSPQHAASACCTCPAAICLAWLTLQLPSGASHAVQCKCLHAMNRHPTPPPPPPPSAASALHHHLTNSARCGVQSAVPRVYCCQAW